MHTQALQQALPASMHVPDHRKRDDKFLRKENERVVENQTRSMLRPGMGEMPVQDPVAQGLSGSDGRSPQNSRLGASGSSGLHSGFQRPQIPT